MQYSTEERVIQYIRKKIQAAKKIVAVLGIEMLVEGGGYDLDTNEETYRVEEEYGVSPEDILSTSFFNAKPERFYRFYKVLFAGYPPLQMEHILYSGNCCFCYPKSDLIRLRHQDLV